MKNRILVAYASGSGSTGEVAEAIGVELQGEGLQVEVNLAQDVTDISDYSAVILGSSIRSGRWLPPAVRFLESFAEAMEQLPVAYFTTCLTLMEETEENRQIVLSYMDPVLELAPNIEPVGLGLFAGSLSPNMEPIVPSGGPYGDFRDWETIRKWAREIGPILSESEKRSDRQPLLSGSVLSYSDMSGDDLTGVDFYGSELQGAKLKKAKLRGADLRESDIKKADLRQADLREARLSWANLNGCNLKESDLRKANLMGSKLKNANLKRANLNQANLNGANLSLANLSEATLKRSDLNWAVLTGADLSRANFSKANLGWADLRDTDLSKAKFKKARYNEHTKWPTDFVPETAGCVLVMGPH